MSRATSRWMALLAATACLTLPAASGIAQERAPITIGAIKSAKSCTVYQQSAGRSSEVATPWLYASSSSWQTWLVKDCVDNFASIRTSLEAALAASGKFSVGGGGYVVSGVISDVSGGGAAPDAPNMGPGGYAISSSGMFVNMDVTVRDRAGRIVYGGLLTKRIETGSSIKVDGFQSDSTATGQAVYGVLQHEVALAAARLIAFHIRPLRVIGGDGDEIVLNYGAPLLKLGTTLQVTSPDGGQVIRYNVTSAADGTAHAAKDGDGDGSRIISGSTAVVLEADDPAANGRRMKRVELP